MILPIQGIGSGIHVESRTELEKTTLHVQRKTIDDRSIKVNLARTYEKRSEAEATAGTGATEI
jgi:hypothetical protein